MDLGVALEDVVPRHADAASFEGEGVGELCVGDFGEALEEGGEAVDDQLELRLGWKAGVVWPGDARLPVPWPVIPLADLRELDQIREMFETARAAPCRSI